MTSSYDTNHYANFSNLLLFHPSRVQIFSSASCFKHTQSKCFLWYERLSVTHVQDYRKDCRFLHLVFAVLDGRREKRFWTEWQQALPEFTLLLISSWIKLSYVTAYPKYLNCATFSKNLLAFFTLWFCPDFWWRDNNTHLAFYAFTSTPTPLQCELEILLFLYGINVVFQQIYIISTEQKLIYLI
jgi:hypothetical protein